MNTKSLPVLDPNLLPSESEFHRNKRTRAEIDDRHTIQYRRRPAEG